MSHNNSVPSHLFQDLDGCADQQCKHGHCETHGEGHRINPIQARFAKDDGWNWHDVIISEVHGQVARAEYFDGSDRLWLWHHQPLDRYFRVGEPCRIHESKSLIRAGRTLLSILVADAT